MLLHMNARHVETVTNLPHKQHVVIKQVRSARGLMRRFMRRHWGIMLAKNKKKKKRKKVRIHMYMRMQDRAELSVGYAPFSASPSTSTHGPFFSTKKVRLRRRALKL